MYADSTGSFAGLAFVVLCHEVMVQSIEAYSNLHICVKKLVLCVKHFGNKNTLVLNRRKVDSIYNIIYIYTYIVINLHIISAGADLSSQYARAYVSGLPFLFSGIPDPQNSQGQNLPDWVPRKLWRKQEALLSLSGL